MLSGSKKSSEKTAGSTSNNSPLNKESSKITYSRNSSKRRITPSGSELNPKYATDTTQNSERKGGQQMSINEKLESSLKRMELFTKNLLKKGREGQDEPRSGQMENFNTGKWCFWSDLLFCLCIMYLVVHFW